MTTVVSPRVSPVLVRAAVWSLFGAIYAPLFIVLRELLAPMGAPQAFVLAAGAAGGIGATFYGSRQLALTASVVGIASGALVLGVFGHQASPWLLAAVALVLGLLAGAAVDFPHRCTANVGLKFLVGGGVASAAAMALVGLDRLLGLVLPVAALVAFLVSITGVLYVSGMHVLAQRGPQLRGRFCSLVEGAVIALIALLVANSLAGFAGLLAEGPAGPMTHALALSAELLPFALLGGMLAGAVTGGLLELFEFGWVDQL
ncbi:hypothetical protein F2Q65_05365 [Thiohalocapsa marina]|uniref:Uncharacterized protein n=1 Tax=Thiohalocapsa marina TaxID=424902 RepID=A0A5M8FMR6_9GAMM|nr:hypothetical protein [Thiohalocapsa marina]KAA6186233.1 hypothetical protein F2Q65_05365 [Thiohalocapsa marina]